MNNWKEVPHLFANGKFQVITSDVVMNIYGIERWLTKNGIDSFVLILEKDGAKIKEGIDSCELIARRIEDMTDEETALSSRYGHPNNPNVPHIWESIRSLMSEHASVDFFNPTEFLQLLDLGVYPFDQNSFNTGEVIDVRTL
jgi:hypothetical protein